WNVLGVTRLSSTSSANRRRRILAFSAVFRKLNMAHLSGKLGAHRGRNPKIGSWRIRTARKDLPMEIGELAGTSGEFAPLPAFDLMPLARRHPVCQCFFASNSAINLRKSARSRTELKSLLLANRSWSLKPAATAF